MDWALMAADPSASSIPTETRVVRLKKAIRVLLDPAPSVSECWRRERDSLLTACLPSRICEHFVPPEPLDPLKWPGWSTYEVHSFGPALQRSFVPDRCAFDKQRTERIV